MKRSRRNHSPVFNEKVALHAIRGDETLAELVHGVHTIAARTRADNELSLQSAEGGGGWTLTIHTPS